MLHIALTNLLLLAAKQVPYKEAYLLTKNIEEFSGKSSGEWTSRQKKDKTGRVIRLVRRTREAIAKWNQMTALRFQTGGRHQTSPERDRGGERERAHFFWISRRRFRRLFWSWLDDLILNWAKRGWGADVLFGSLLISKLPAKAAAKSSIVSRP